jgi:hypothetical protein
MLFCEDVSGSVHFHGPAATYSLSGQPVAALQDNLAAWRGLGASLMSLWSARRLGLRTCFRITTVLLFFLAVSALQIVTPTVITVDTTNTTDTVLLRAKRMTVDSAIGPALSRITAENGPGGAIGAISAFPYVWGQRNTSGTGSPPGYNGTLVSLQQTTTTLRYPDFLIHRLFFSPLEKTVSEDFVYTDPYAREARTFCASIPPSSADNFIFRFRMAGKPIWVCYIGHQLIVLCLDHANPGTFNAEIDVGTVIPNNGTVRFRNSLTVYNSFGGEKATKSSPPTYSCSLHS